MLSECPAGSGSRSTLNISGGAPVFPGGLNWDRVNCDLIIGDQECSGMP